MFIWRKNHFHQMKKLVDTLYSCSEKILKEEQYLKEAIAHTKHMKNLLEDDEAFVGQMKKPSSRLIEEWMSKEGKEYLETKFPEESFKIKEIDTAINNISELVGDYKHELLKLEQNLPKYKPEEYAEVIKRFDASVADLKSFLVLLKSELDDFERLSDHFNQLEEKSESEFKKVIGVDWKSLHIYQNVPHFINKLWHYGGISHKNIYDTVNSLIDSLKRANYNPGVACQQSLRGLRIEKLMYNEGLFSIHIDGPHVIYWFLATVNGVRTLFLCEVFGPEHEKVNGRTPGYYISNITKKPEREVILAELAHVARLKGKNVESAWMRFD